MSENCPPACVRLISPGRENQIEGACPQAETIWTGFLGASRLLGVKPTIEDLFTPEGERLGKAVRKDHTPVHRHPSERNNPTYFGQPTYYVVESPYPELERSIVVVKEDKRVYFRPFKSVEISVEIARKNAQETECLGGDPKRIVDLLAYIDLATESQAPEFGRVPSTDEVFEHALQWALR